MKLKEVVSLQRGHDLTDAHRQPGGVPVMSAAGQYGFHNAAIAHGPGVVIGRSGASIGQVHFCRSDFWPHNTALYVTNFHGNDPLFIFYFLKSLNLFRYNSGGAQPSLNRNFVYPLEVTLPELDKQRAIAKTLSDVDDLITALDTLITKKRAIKQATIQQLLTGKKRLPGFSNKWTELNMARDSVLKARIGWQGLTTAEYLDTGDYYLVTGTDFVGGRVDWSSCWFVDRNRFIQDRNIQLAPGDVLLTKDGTIGKAGYVDSLAGPATLNSGIFVIRPKAGAYMPMYMYYVLTSSIFDDFLTRLQAGSTISHLYQKDFVGFTFKAPPTDEQCAIATILSDMDAEIGVLELRRDKTKQIKQGMMQELLTGRTRLV